MPLPGVLEALLGKHLETLAERVEHRDGRRVVVAARGRGPGLSEHVLADHVHVEVPVLHGLLATGHLFERTLAHSERRHARRDAERLLAASVCRVHAPFVDEQRDATDGSDRIREEDAVVLPAEVRHALERLARPSGRLCVCNPEDLRLVLGEGSLELVDGEDLAPGTVDAGHVVCVARGHVHGALAKVAVHCAQCHIPILCQVGVRSLPRRRAGARHRDGEDVFRLPGVAQKLLSLLHQVDEVSVHVPYHGGCHGSVHAWVGV
mmetsp:Transcript_26190/g.76816  ORF Transcript_26190/g.76816 Transcript_26190/m.76816 type:complete len:264 (-) Transcript_26190:233-1024(-)